VRPIGNARTVVAGEGFPPVFRFLAAKPRLRSVPVHMCTQALLRIRMHTYIYIYKYVDGARSNRRSPVVYTFCYVRYSKIVVIIIVVIVVV